MLVFTIKANNVRATVTFATSFDRLYYKSHLPVHDAKPYKCICNVTNMQIIPRHPISIVSFFPSNIWLIALELISLGTDVVHVIISPGDDYR